MCKVMEDMRQSAAKEAAEKATWQTKIESVLRWMKKGLSLEDIAEGEDLTIEQVREIAAAQKA